MISVRNLCLLLLLLCSSMSGVAQCREMSRTWLFGAGHNALYDSYLSPLDYAGPTLGTTFITERKACWGGDAVTSMVLVDVNLSMSDNASGNASFYDAALDVSFGWHYNRTLGEHWHAKAGGLVDINGGGTYSTRNGNNPGQGRAALALAASGALDYQFRVGHRTWKACLQTDVPLVGVQFSPQFGQSYYEIFELGHYDHNVCFTSTFNAPSLRAIVTLDIPVRKAHLLVGYKADVRQSTVNQLDRHAWNNMFILGFTRNISLR